MTKTKFELDKVYKTRDGREARVICVDAPGTYSVVGIFGGEIGRWTADGSYAHGITGCTDLMLPKPEPIVEWGRLTDKGYFYQASSEAIARNPKCWTKPGEQDWPVAKRTTEIVED